MYIVIIDGQDMSAHTHQSDADWQKSRFESLGHVNVTIEEKDEFNPPPRSEN